MLQITPVERILIISRHRPLQQLLNRFYDVLLSVYLYNEKRGYTYLDKLILAFEKKFPAETQMIGAIRKHAADERHHYELFLKHFHRNGRNPFAVSAWYGYCDQIVAIIFGKTIDQISPQEIVNNEKNFFQLCRLIMITEMRGMKQAELVLRNPLIRRDPELVKIFEVVKKDEPSHCYPYQTWLRKHGAHEPSLREVLADFMVHYALVLVKLPLLYCNFFLRRESV